MTDDQSAKLLRALQFFDGKLVNKRKPKAQYNDPAEGLFSERRLTLEEENESREAITSLLRSPNPDQGLLDRIAGAFAPDGSQDAGPRRADLKYRLKHRPPDLMRAVQVILEVEQRHGSGMTYEVARAEVAQRHGLTEKAVRSTLEEWSELRKSVIKALDPDK